MAKTRKEKEVLLDSYKQLIADSKGFILVKPQKVTPNEATQIKKDLFESESEYHVVKNTIFKIALEQNDLDAVESLEEGSHAVIYFGEDIVTPSKILDKYKKELKVGPQKKSASKLEIVGGFLDGQLLTKEQVEELAEMPSKEGSVALILGILDSAMSGVANVLEDAPRSYATIIDKAFKE